MTDTIRETGDRAAFLSAIGRAIGTSDSQFSRPVGALPAPLPPIAYATPTETGDGDLVERFAAALTALGGVVRTVADGARLADVVRDALALARRRDEPVRVVLSDDPECARLHAYLGAHPAVELLDYTDAAAVATADLGITGAAAAVALTGSIVVDAGRAGGRTVSLLPPVHLALVAADAIVATPGDHWRSLRSLMPSNLVQITGPSRSADIELIITLGVHGPRALWVALLV